MYPQLPGQDGDFSLGFLSFSPVPKSKTQEAGMGVGRSVLPCAPYWKKSEAGSPATRTRFNKGMETPILFPRPRMSPTISF